MNIIYKKNFDEHIKKHFSQYTKSIIRGKGPTYKELEVFDKNTLYISVNDVVNVTEYTDLMVANDIEMFDRINKDKISKVKYLLVPNKIHKAKRPRPNISYEDVITKLNGTFTGNLIVYNLRSGEKDEKFIELSSLCSSSNSAADLIGQYIHNIQHITFYGVGVLNRGGYSDVFPKTKSVTDYIPARIESIRTNAVRSLKNLCCKDCLKNRKVEFL